MICPICRKSRAAGRYSPFCSRRCADEDLSHWLSGAYAVPAELTEADEAQQTRQSEPNGDPQKAPKS